MAAVQNTTKFDSVLKKSEIFSSNAFIIIEGMLQLVTEETAELVDEVLHSIFFLGKIQHPSISPEDILTDGYMLNELRNAFPRPFKLYLSQLPRRSPISCVLEMIVKRTVCQPEERENEIIRQLQKLIVQLKQVKTKKKILVSSTICVSQNTKIPGSVRYYGVSMSTSGPIPGRIMVAASCLNSWDTYVAGAVMTYYPGEEKKRYFDGTIKLPAYVSCQAIRLSDRRPMDPCRSCGNLFGLETSEQKPWPYGNCAEVESLSNLLKSEKEVREQVRPTSDTYTEENLERAKESVREELKGLLRQVKFRWDNNANFYTPQGVSPV